MFLKVDKSIYEVYLDICYILSNKIKLRLMSPPERATISLTVKPLLENLLISSLRLENGEGRFELAATPLAVAESLLPNSTVQPSPSS